ncbi:MAG TPA: hypothetical protein VK921_01540 [Anditalea sp.]|nr:hypothetical protein [Anditalea sp.]
MQIDLQFSNLWVAIFTASLIVLLALSLVLIYRNPTISPSIKALKTGLNLFFFLSLILLVVQPYFYREYIPRNILVYGTDVPREYLDRLKDSLNMDEARSIDDYESSADYVYLTGQQFTTLQLGKLQQANVTWIPYQPEAVVEDIRWDGLLRQGQTQTIHGTYNTVEEVFLSLRFGDEILDSVLIGPNNPNFRLTAQAKAIGRNLLTLEANSREVGKINFFVTENNPIHYRMLFSYPDMEIRRLSEWLGNKGQGISATVYTSTSVIRQSTNIDNADTLQFLITEPAFANSSAVGDAIASGATVLFTNFGNVDRELLQINRALGTDWSVNRSHPEGSRTIEGSLTALPYRLITQPQQWELFEAAAGYQRIGKAKVGVSLLEATFPIALQGDSIGYAAVWDRMLYAMRPIEGTSFHIPQPLFTGLGSNEWVINSQQDIDEVVSIAGDSIYFTPSPVNPRSHTGYSQASSSGWKTFADSLEIYFHGEDDNFQFVRNKNQINQFIHYHQGSLDSTAPLYHKIQLSAWWWLILVLLSATLLWIEPRMGR